MNKNIENNLRMKQQKGKLRLDHNSYYYINFDNLVYKFDLTSWVLYTSETYYSDYLYNYVKRYT